MLIYRIYRAQILNLLLKCRRLARVDANFKILRRLQRLNLKATRKNANLNRSANLAARICVNRLNLKFRGAAFIAKLDWRLLLPLFKILNLPAHFVFQLIHKRGYVIINRTLPLLLA
ncbi:hypothetical protein [uncultured Campylobacter sp.]|uniref:hypothetical protein n=1 Tax=uncultured Campylobacter sp. TaxID=218934 RepID=UPI00260A9476|nr:hypothetical protein [uncultured Campylobacter sp.]